MRSERGFGLLEMLFALALASFVCLGALSLLDAGSRSLRVADSTLSTLETRQVALSSLRASLSRVRANLCGDRAAWRNHLTLADDAWWSRVRIGSYAYGTQELAPGTSFGTSAARRVAGTAALDVYYFAPDAGDLLSQDSPASELRVSSIQGYAAGEVATVCSPVSTDVFMVSAKTTGRLFHDSAAVNAYGLRNCSAGFWNQTMCSGALRCVVGRGVGTECPLVSAMVSARLGHVRAERWYIAKNASAEKALYMAQLENDGITGTPTAVRPNEIVAGVEDLVVSIWSGGGWTSLPSSAVPIDGTPVQVALKLSDETWVRTFLTLGRVQR